MRGRLAAWALGAGLIALIAAALGAHLNRAPQRDERALEVRAALLRWHANPLDESALPLRDVERMIAIVGDPYTVYLSPARYREVLADSGRSLETGLRVVEAGGRLRVAGADTGSPAALAGLSPGDFILAIDGASTSDLRAALHRLAGERGTRVVVRVRRSAGGEALFRLIRREAAPGAVAYRDYGSPERRVRVIRIATFKRGVAARVRALATSADRVILDMRGNRGGLLGEAVGVVSAFAPPGSAVVRWHGRGVGSRVIYASGKPLAARPIAVLVDQHTASAAEIVAAALQDHDLATVVGIETYGKASVQAVHRLASGGALKLTVAHYVTAGGHEIDGVGIHPDIRAVGDIALLAALEAARR